MALVSSSSDSLAARKQIMLRSKASQRESYSVEELKSNIPISAMVNPYINRLVLRTTYYYILIGTVDFSLLPSRPTPPPHPFIRSLVGEREREREIPSLSSTQCH